MGILDDVKPMVRKFLRAQAAIAALPFNLERARGLDPNEDKRRERATADSVRDADALMAALEERR
jgi:hypothetical protein